MATRAIELAVVAEEHIQVRYRDVWGGWIALAMGSMRHGSQRAMVAMARDARQLARDDSTVAVESHNVSWRECWHVRDLLLN